MRFTQTLIRTSRELLNDEPSRNAQLLLRAGFVDKLMAGTFTYLPLGQRVLQKIMDLVRKHMTAVEGIELLMPALHPKMNYEATGRWDSFDVLFRFTTHWTKTEYALGATHEEIVTPLMKRYIQSYKDLPKAVYQIQDKFRDEKRAKSGLLRGREFYMKDLYSFHATEADLDTYYDRVAEAYMAIFKDLGIAGRTYFTYASGGAFTKYSHEFQTLSAAGEDLIYICDACQIAVNKEILTDQPDCPGCGSNQLREEKAIEVGNIFKLMTRFTDAFGMTYMDQEGKSVPVLMGCYGLGIGRLMGVVAEVLSDKQGLVWPEAIAPYKVHLVGLNLEDAEVRNAIDELYAQLTQTNVEVLYDDRPDVSAGQKFSDADLIGCPIRLTVSKRTLANGQAEVKLRSEENASLHDIASVAESF